jgi:hypothetical protein
MIWDRHWLELRARLPFLAAAAIALGAWPMTLFDGENAVFVEFLASRPHSPDAEALALAISRIFFILWGGAIALGGNGLRTWYMDRVAPSDMELPFTLTLPISRMRIVATRLAAGWLAAMLVAVLVLGSQYTVQAIQGRSVPAGAGVNAVAWLAIGMAAWIVVYGGVLMTRGIWMFLFLMGGILVCLPLSLTLMLGGLGGNVTAIASSLAALAGLASGAFAFTVHRARRLEC